MIARMMQLKCAGYGPTVTEADKFKNVAVNIGGTLALALIWLVLVWIGKHRQFTGSSYVMPLLPMTYVLPYLVGLRYTSLKGRSSRAQTILIVGLASVVTGILLVAGWITNL